MKHQFTTQDLVRYLYNEVSYLEGIAIEKALKSDLAFAASFEALKQGEAMLNSIELEPSEFSIQSILNYSQNTEFEAKTL